MSAYHVVAFCPSHLARSALLRIPEFFRPPPPTLLRIVNQGPIYFDAVEITQDCIPIDDLAKYPKFVDRMVYLGKQAPHSRKLYGLLRRGLRANPQPLEHLALRQRVDNLDVDSSLMSFHKLLRRVE
jgi:hypothetical protein